MHTLLLIAALSNQITFNTTQQGEMYTIIPQVTLTQPCECQVQVFAIREGKGGKAKHNRKQAFWSLLIGRLI